MKNRLTQLLLNLPANKKYVDGVCVGEQLHTAETIADYLLSEGVVVPPVKVGQTLYKVYMGKILEVKAISICYELLPAYTYTIHFNSLGVLRLMSDGTRNEKCSWDIYITREEAEQALREAVAE